MFHFTYSPPPVTILTGPKCNLTFHSFTHLAKEKVGKKGHVQRKLGKHLARPKMERTGSRPPPASGVRAARPGYALPCPGLQNRSHPGRWGPAWEPAQNSGCFTRCALSDQSQGCNPWTPVPRCRFQGAAGGPRGRGDPGRGGTTGAEPAQTWQRRAPQPAPSPSCVGWKLPGRVPSCAPAHGKAHLRSRKGLRPPWGPLTTSPSGIQTTFPETTTVLHLQLIPRENCQVS